MIKIILMALILTICVNADKCDIGYKYLADTINKSELVDVYTDWDKTYGRLKRLKGEGNGRTYRFDYLYEHDTVSIHDLQYIYKNATKNDTELIELLRQQLRELMHIRKVGKKVAATCRRSYEYGVYRNINNRESFDYHSLQFDITGIDKIRDTLVNYIRYLEHAEISFQDELDKEAKKKAEQNKKDYADFAKEFE